MYHQRLDSGEIQVNCIIRVNEYTPNTVQGKRLVIVMELDVLPGPVPPKVRAGHARMCVRACARAPRAPPPADDGRAEADWLARLV